MSIYQEAVVIKDETNELEQEWPSIYRGKQKMSKEEEEKFHGKETIPSEITSCHVVKYVEKKKENFLQKIVSFISSKRKEKPIELDLKNHVEYNPETGKVGNGFDDFFIGAIEHNKRLKRRIKRKLKRENRSKIKDILSYHLKLIRW